MSTAEPDFVAGTLAWCNQQRAEKGMEPLDRLPKGRRFDGRSCPCGKATGLHVSVGFYYAVGEDGLVSDKDDPLPSPVVAFVKAFDREELPQYDEAA